MNIYVFLRIYTINNYNIQFDADPNTNIDLLNLNVVSYWALVETSTLVSAILV